MWCRRIILSYGLFLCFGGSAVFAGNPEDLSPEQQAMVERAKATATEAKKTLSQEDIDAIIAKAQATIEATNERTRKSIKENNRVLFSKGLFSLGKDEKLLPESLSDFEGLIPRGNYHVGFYKGDVARLTLLAADYSADYWFHKKIKTARTKYIFEKIERNPEELLHTLQEMQNDSTAVASLEEHRFLHYLKSFVKRDHPKVKAVKQYITKHHHFVGFNPVRRELFVPLVGMFASQELSCYLHTEIERYNTRFEESFAKYEKDDDGNLIRISSNDHIISIVTLLQMIKSPVSVPYNLVMQYWGSEVRLAKTFLTSFFDCEPPKFLFSQWFQFCARVVVFLSAVKMFNHFCADLWTDHVLQNREELIVLLTKYIAARDGGSIEKINNAKERLEKFVIKGHELVSFLPFKNVRAWLGARRGAHRWYLLGFGSVVLIPVLWNVIPKMREYL